STTGVHSLGPTANRLRSSSTDAPRSWRAKFSGDGRALNAPVQEEPVVRRLRLEQLEADPLHARRSEWNGAAEPLHIAGESDSSPSNEIGRGDAGEVGDLAEPDFGGVSAL